MTNTLTHSASRLDELYNASFCLDPRGQFCFADENIEYFERSFGLPYSERAQIGPGRWLMREEAMICVEELLGEEATCFEQFLGEDC